MTVQRAIVAMLMASILFLSWALVGDGLSLREDHRRKNVIEKIERTLDVFVPFLILLFSALNLAGVVEVVDKAVPVLYGALATLQAVFKIWGIALRATRKT